jgi:hypothetical protein
MRLSDHNLERQLLKLVTLKAETSTRALFKQPNNRIAWSIAKEVRMHNMILTHRFMLFVVLIDAVTSAPRFRGIPFNRYNEYLQFSQNPSNDKLNAAAWWNSVKHKHAAQVNLPAKSKALTSKIAVSNNKKTSKTAKKKKARPRPTKLLRRRPK